MNKLETFAALCREQRRLEEEKSSTAHGYAWDSLGRSLFPSAQESVSRIDFLIRQIKRAKRALVKGEMA